MQVRNEFVLKRNGQQDLQDAVLNLKLTTAPHKCLRCPGIEDHMNALRFYFFPSRALICVFVRSSWDMQGFLRQRV